MVLRLWTSHDNVEQSNVETTPSSHYVCVEHGAKLR